MLSHRPEVIHNKLKIILGGDSICVGALYNPTITISKKRFTPVNSGSGEGPRPCEDPIHLLLGQMVSSPAAARTADLLSWQQLLWPAASCHHNICTAVIWLILKLVMIF